MNFLNTTSLESNKQIEINFDGGDGNELLAKKT